jgi:hypothetical protein
MSILCFASPKDRIGKAIIQALENQLPDEGVDFCTTAGNLALKLADHRNDEEAAILVPEDEDKLIDIYSVKSLFSRIPVVLVLPNRDRFVEAMGYRLKPRIMCYRDAGIMVAIDTLKDIVKDSRNVNIHKVRSYE